MELSILHSRPAGYAFLVKKLEIRTLPHWHTSYVSSLAKRVSMLRDGEKIDIYPEKYWPGELIGNQLEFALKYDGTNLELLAQIFKHISHDVLIQYILSKPTGKYTRRIWFFYEFLLEEQLPIEDLPHGNFINALETEKYYTIENGQKSSRHRIINNLIGVQNFCPIIRKTTKLNELETTDLRKKCEDILSVYPLKLLHRALSYLYNKETKSSFAIEYISPNTSRIEKFITALQLAEKDDFCEKTRLIALQNLIVDARFQDNDYRTTQNYVGQTLGYQNEIIHFICPRPEDLPNLMQGLLDTHERIKAGNVLPLIHAATIAYGFVFLHPFEDGNGRIHRFLIHNILSLQKMVPTGLIFPISAAMLKYPVDYDRSLEAFSQPLLKMIDYQLDDMGQMSIENNTKCWYQYMDLTQQSEALYEFVKKTIEQELVQELSFLVNYDKTKQAIQKIIDMPDRLIDLFIRLSQQNNGKLSTKKRASHFHFLTDRELQDMENVLQENYQQTKKSPKQEPSNANPQHKS